jgi:hypothetical protein
MMEPYDPFEAPDPQEWLALDEGERVELVEDYHRQAGIRLPNVKAHAAIHAVVENQAALGDETPVRRALHRLVSEGLDRHDAIHAIGKAFTDVMYDLMNNTAADQDTNPNPKYFAAVERLTTEGWRSADESTEEEMDATRILEELSVVNKLPVAAIRAARAQRAAIVPAFMQAIERCIEEEAKRPERDALFFIFHLLGEWREKSAYRLLATLLRRPPDEIDEILGDATAATSHRVMAAVFDGDPQPLYDMILDPAADEYVRSRMCEALVIVTLRNELPRAEAARFLQACYSDIRPQSDCYVWVGWASAIAALGLVELTTIVERAFKRRFVESYVMRFERFEEDLQRALEHPSAPGRQSDEFTLFGDTVEELSTWAAFDPDRKSGKERETSGGEAYWTPSVPAVNPFKGVGRNDPCPCGSGKKFKKCCLDSVLTSGELRGSTS